jgi:glycosyltransferase involved in cell wall biosynthesis
LKILLAHNYTQGYATGGEGHVFEDEASILQNHGHEVYKLLCSNSEATDATLIGKLKAFINAAWSKDGYRRMSQAIEQFKPDIIHIHNFFLIYSPSIFKAAYDHRVPAVVTLHNYRMVSPCSQLLRNGEICELCVNRNPWRILLYRCYKKSFWASLLRYRIYYLSRKMHHWEDYVDKFFALTGFGKDKLIESGMDASKLHILPNSVPDPLKNEPLSRPGNYALFIGMVDRHKGIESLIEAWRIFDFPLIVVGDGDLRQGLQSISPTNVRFLGIQSREKVSDLLRNCAFLIIPSIWYEGLPLVALEGMSMGRAIAGSGHGAIAAVVRDGITGLHFIPGDIADMRNKIQRLISDPELARKLGENGRKDYLAKYTPERHYETLIKNYKEVIKRRAGL